MLIIILIILSLVFYLSYFYAISIRSSNSINETSNNLWKSEAMPNGMDGLTEDEFNTYEWKYVLSNKGVDVYTKKVPGTKLLAFRGVSVLDYHISDILRPFANLNLSYQWIDMLKSIQAFDLHPNDSSNHDHETVTEYFHRRGEDIVHQYLALPWPISPRELLLHRTWIINSNDKSVTFKYRSVNDNRVPLKEGVIRAVSPHTLWKFSALDTDRTVGDNQNYLSSNKQNSNMVSAEKSDIGIKQLTVKFFITGIARIFLSTLLRPIKNFLLSLWRIIGIQRNLQSGPGFSDTEVSRGSRFTLVEIECLVDTKGRLPAWFLNYMQRSFPPKSIEAFSKLARKELGRGQDFPLVAKW